MDNRDMLQRGSIVWIKNPITPVGSEQGGERPAVVVSNDMGNANSGNVEVVYLTTQPKRDLPTHVTIHSAEEPSTVLCECITTISKERIQRILGKVTRQEIDSIDIALLISVGLDKYLASPARQRPPITTKQEQPSAPVIIPENKEEVINLRMRLVSAQTEAKVYKELVEKLMQ